MERTIRRVVADTAVVVTPLIRRHQPAVTAAASAGGDDSFSHGVDLGPLPIIPNMETGATDGLFLRNAGIPVYGVTGCSSTRQCGRHARTRTQRADRREGVLRSARVHVPAAEGARGEHGVRWVPFRAGRNSEQDHLIPSERSRTRGILRFLIEGPLLGGQGFLDTGLRPPLGMTSSSTTADPWDPAPDATPGFRQCGP